MSNLSIGVSIFHPARYSEGYLSPALSSPMDDGMADFSDLALVDSHEYYDYLNGIHCHSPSPTSRSRSRPPSVGPTRSARRANSFSNPPRPHAIVIPGRANMYNPDYQDLSSLVHPVPYTPYYYGSPLDVDTLVAINSLPAQMPLPKPAMSAPASSSVKPLDPDVHLSEKRRRRRESHNAVERRRRDNINERIGELASLIPGVLFECDGRIGAPLPGDDVFAALDSGMHVLPVDEGLPDLPEEALVKRDPCEDGELMSPISPVGNAIVNEPSTIKANKGMILRKSVEYIRYLQQLVSVQASRGKELEERNRALECELAVLRGELSLSSSPSVLSSTVLSMSSSRASASSKPSSVADSNAERCGEDLDMEDASVDSGERSRERFDELRGRRPARAHDKLVLTFGMEM